MTHNLKKRYLSTSKLVCGGLSVLALVTLPVLSVASEPVKRVGETNVEGTVINVNDRIVVTGRLGIGMLSGESKELVYNAGSGTRLSELTWSFDNNVMVGGGLSIRFTRWLKINGDFWVAVSDDSTMDDYDWLVDGYDWSDWSHHEDTELTTGTMFDVNAEFSFYRPSNFNFFGVAGIKRDNWAWDARGGDYTYSVNGFRDTTGSFPDGLLGISYEQDLLTPYFGIGMAGGSENFTFTVRLVGSPFVDASATDTHYLKDLRFEDEFSDGTMIAFDVACAYHFTGGVSIAAGFHYQDYSDIKGYTVITDLTNGQKYRTADDTAGLEHSSTLLNLQLIYDF